MNEKKRRKSVSMNYVDSMHGQNATFTPWNHLTPFPGLRSAQGPDSLPVRRLEADPDFLEHTRQETLAQFQLPWEP